MISCFSISTITTPTPAIFNLVVSFMDLYNGLFNDDKHELSGGLGMYVILVLGTVMKLGLYVYCSKINVKLKLDTLDALIEDHMNDVSTPIRYCSVLGSCSGGIE